MAQVTGLKEFASLSNGEIFISAVTTTAADGTASITHGMVNSQGVAVAPRLAIAIPMDGADGSAVVVAATTTAVTLASGGNAQKYIALAFR